MCTPARNTLFTGLFPAQHRSSDTLTEGFVQSEEEHQLDPSLPNLATTLKAAGYEVVYKGKWHLSKPVESCNGEVLHDDISRYGFDQWDAPDAGQDVKIENYGGGTANHDERYTDDAVAYLEHKRDNPGGKPFCLVVSLVNPHDVLGYPKNVGLDGYTEADLEGNIPLPPTLDENLLENHKPTCQRELLAKLNGLGPLITDAQRRDYLNFYGNLLKRVDAHLQIPPERPFEPKRWSCALPTTEKWDSVTEVCVRKRSTATRKRCAFRWCGRIPNCFPKDAPPVTSFHT